MTEANNYGYNLDPDNNELDLIADYIATYTFTNYDFTLVVMQTNTITI